MQSHPQPNEDSSSPNDRPERARCSREPAYADLTSAAPPEQVARALVGHARADVVAAGIHARLDHRQRGPHLVVLKRSVATDGHVLNRVKQALVGWFVDHPRAAEAYLGSWRDARQGDDGLAALGARRLDIELAHPAGARIPVDTPAGASLLAARVTDGLPRGGLTAELVPIGCERPIPTQALAGGTNPRIVEAAIEQLIGLCHEQRAQAAGLLPAVSINQRIHQQPTLAAWLRFGRALTLDAIDHRAMSRTTVLFIAAADGAPKGKLSGRWNAIIHPNPARADDPDLRRVASSAVEWDPEADTAARPRALAPLLDQVLGSLDRRPRRAGRARVVKAPPPVQDNTSEHGGDHAAPPPSS